MAFLGPAISAGAGLLGGLFGGKNKLSREQKALLQWQTDLSKADYGRQINIADMNVQPQLAQAWQAIQPYLNDTSPDIGLFLKYLQQGSPYLKDMQRQVAETVARGSQNAGADAAQRLAQRGYGYAPTGAGAAMQGDIARGETETLADKWLQNLLANEQMKFNAAGAYGSAKRGAISGLQSNVDRYLNEMGHFNPSAPIASSSNIVNNPRGGGGIGAAIGGALSGLDAGLQNAGFGSSGGSSAPRQVPPSTGNYSPPGQAPVVPVSGNPSALSSWFDPSQFYKPSYGGGA